MWLLDQLFHWPLATIAECCAGAALAAVLLGAWLRSRPTFESGCAALLWFAALGAGERLLVLGRLGTQFRDSPLAPPFAIAPLMGLTALGVSAVWGALSRRWRPWEGVWLAGGAAAVASAAVAWGQLDRPALWRPPPPDLLIGHCMASRWSAADFLWCDPGPWLLVSAVCAVLATACHAAAPRIPDRALSRVAAALLVGGRILVGFALWGDLTRPQPPDWFDSLDRVGTLAVEPGPVDQLALPPEILDRLDLGVWQTSWVPGAAATGAEDPRLEAANRWLLARPPTVAPGLELRSSRAGDVLVVSSSNFAARIDGEPTGDYLEQREHELVYWSFVADQLAPPWSWTLAAAVGSAASAALAGSRAGSRASARTLAAMRVAVVAAGGTPLFVATIRGFVLP